MKTIIHKDNGRFSALNLMTDDILDVERLEDILRCAEDSPFYSNLEIETKMLIKTLLEPCQSITLETPSELPY